MNIGALTPDNLRFVKSYKKIGYSTKTRLIEDALTLLRQKQESRLREKTLMKASLEYQEPYAWGGIDGDDFKK